MQVPVCSGLVASCNIYLFFCLVGVQVADSQVDGHSAGQNMFGKIKFNLNLIRDVITST